MPPKRKTGSRGSSLSIPAKANKILNLILLVMAFIIIRCWHLSVVQYEDRLAGSRRPQRRVVIERAERGTIRDRFNLPLAVNKVQYNAAIFYAHIREIPSIAWERNTEGDRVKVRKRSEHITQLSELLGGELSMDPERIEDLIHSKASLFPNTAFVIKEDISEKEYFRLKALEKDWLGLYGERVPKRHYIQNRSAADVLGYMGAISREQYLSVSDETRELKEYLKAWEQGLELELPEGMDNPMQVRHRLQDLQQKAYTINDYVGKSGIEGKFDENLRGFYGKRTYYTDARGNFLRELPGAREPLSGQRFLLSISSELQEFAEELLVKSEEIREGRSTTFDWSKREYLSLKQPWIKGGAILAMDPKTGEVLAMATYPRFDPNDFVSVGSWDQRKKKISNVRQWFESENYLAEIWDGLRPLTRERFSERKGDIVDEERDLTWNNYINFILPKGNEARRTIQNLSTIDNAIFLQGVFEELQELSGQESAYNIFNVLYNEKGHVIYRDRMSTVEKEEIRARFAENSEKVSQLKNKLDIYFSTVPNNYDKVLVLDLCRLAVLNEAFSSDLLLKTGKQSIAEYREASRAMAVISEVVRGMAKNVFREEDFKTWRKEHQKEYLQEKRRKERAAKRYSRPYLDYLDKKEKKLFREFWETYRLSLIMTFVTGDIPEKRIMSEEAEPYFHYFQSWSTELSQGAHQLAAWHESYKVLKKAVAGLSKESGVEYLQSMRNFHDSTRPLLGKYRNIRSNEGEQLEKHLAAAFYPVYGYGFARSQIYRQATPQGSIFKLVVAYEALAQRYQQLIETGESLKKLNPLDMVDQVKKIGGKNSPWIVGYRLDGEPIPQFYNGGRLPRSERRNIGRINLINALEVSSNPYFSLLAGDVLNDPLDLNEAAKKFSFGKRTGIDLTGEISGRLPKDLLEDRTGLYAYAIGQHSLVVTPLQTGVMLSAMVNGGKVFKPKIVNMIAGKEPVRGDEQIFSKSDFAFKNSLALVGVDFPLFTAAESQRQKKLVNFIPSKVENELFMPEPIREMLVAGMQKVVTSKRGSARPGSMRTYYGHPEILQDYEDLHEQIIGKTSTSEIVESVDLDLEMGAYRYKHIWFAGVSYDPDEQVSSGKKLEIPELVVVVYLRFGDYGKEAAPLVGQIVKKWREIKAKHSKLES